MKSAAVLRLTYASAADLLRLSRARFRSSIESLTRTRAASPFRSLTVGFTSSNPYVRLNRRLLYSRASAANQIPIATSAEDLDVLSRAILTFDHASSNAFFSLNSKYSCSTEDLSDKEGCPIRQ